MFSKNQLIKLLKNTNFLTYSKLAKSLNIPFSKNGEFSDFLFSMIKTGEILKTQTGEYFVPLYICEVETNFRLSSKGFGFVDIPSENEDSDDSYAFVSPDNKLSAMDGDLIKAKIFKDPLRANSFQGVITEIIKRNKTSFVGRTMRLNHKWIIKPLDPKITSRFRFEDTSELKEDLEVKVEITKYGSDFNTIKVVKILGDWHDTSVDIIAAIEDANVPYEFNANTIDEAKQVPKEVLLDDLKDRRDLRENLIVTIDGDDTKDFDDAIEVRKLDNGNYLLGVHIADVTHYVHENKPLDDEAKQRGTSIYLVDRVLPMLPEELSNGICSLNPNVDRLVISCEMEIDQQGQTVKYDVFPAVINSKYRLTYQEVNRFYHGLTQFDNEDLEKMLNLSLELARIIRRFKEKEGYIDFEITESKIIVDDQGKTVDIVPRERFESEMLIEDFMVRANETIAHYVAKNNLPFIYRIHDKPDLVRVTSLQNVVKTLGIDVTIPQQSIPIQFANAINKLKNSRFDDFMKIMMLRTMAKAEYSSKNIGHFGLASKYYTHFTSPIRRYPDLMVHRMLREYFFNNRKDLATHFGSILGDISEHSSLCEQKAVELERRVDDIKKAEFYEKFVGQKFKGVIVSMMSFGFFVEFPNKVGGLVHNSTLDDNYELTNNGYTLTNKKNSFTIGDEIEVVVVKAFKEEGKIDLVVANMHEKWLAKTGKK